MPSSNASPSAPPYEPAGSEDVYAQQLEAMFQRFDQLIGQSPAGEQPWQMQLREEFRCALEELRTSAEEIRAQQVEVKAAHRAAERERRRFFDLFNFAPDAYLVTDLRGHVREANQAALRLFDVSWRYLEEMPIITLVQDEDRAAFRRQFERLGPQSRLEEWQVSMRAPKGEPFPASITVAGMYYDDDEVALCWLIRDVTERKRREDLERTHAAEMAHLARLSVMGEMAAGLAHELNQPLAAISNYARGCLRLLAEGTQPARNLTQPITEICHQAERGGEVIRRLREFVQKRAMTSEQVNVNDLVRETLTLAEWELRGSQARLELHLAPRLPRVAVDRIQIQQVLLNLIRNALEAMTEIDPAERRLKVRTEALGEGRVLVSVSDSGAGVPPEMAQRLFDPFFTTKSQGMGMGLTICRTVLQAHGQRIWATDNSPRGATFNFTLSAERGDRA